MVYLSIFEVVRGEFMLFQVHVVRSAFVQSVSWRVLNPQMAGSVYSERVRRQAVGLPRGRTGEALCLRGVLKPCDGSAFGGQRRWLPVLLIRVIMQNSRHLFQ